MDAHARPARAAELPPRLVKAGRLGEVFRLGGLRAVGERQGLRPGPREAEPDLAAGLQVEDEVVERTLPASFHQLGDVREPTFFHGRLQLGPRLAMCTALTPALLREQDVALRTQRRQLLFQRLHLRAYAGDPVLELFFSQTGQVLWHGVGSYSSTGGLGRGLRVRTKAAAMTNTTVTTASSISPVV